MSEEILEEAEKLIDGMLYVMFYIMACPLILFTLMELILGNYYNAAGLFLSAIMSFELGIIGLCKLHT